MIDSIPERSSGSDEPIRLDMSGIGHRFGGVVALDGVDLQVAPGRVHALLGENGAGKSTLMRILSGAIRPDEGRMMLEGEPYDPRNPRDARDAGVAMIYQELNLARHLTVAQNILLGREPSRIGLVRRSAARRITMDALDRLGHSSIDPDTILGRLSPGQQQVVEIARALVDNASVLVMDEPTSSLSLDDVERLFEVIRRLKESGVSIIYISHFLDEIMRVGDDYTVLRDGCNAGSGRLEQTTTDELIRLMIGRTIEDTYPRTDHGIGDPMLRIDDVVIEPGGSPSSLTLHRGEILGLAGLMGAGRTRLARVVAGLDDVCSGRIRVGSSLSPCDGSVRRRLDRGIGMLSEDRKDEGLAMDLSIATNTVLSRPSAVSTLGFTSRRRVTTATDGWRDRLGIRSSGPWQRVSMLSGGNQQKVALARLLHHDVEVFLLDEPTRGIDVASKREVYALLGNLASRGRGLLVISSHVGELLGTCDTIAVMHRGSIRETRAADEWTEREILNVAMTGSSS